MSLVPEVFCDRCGFCHPDHEDWRAILARDVADVAFHVVDFQEEVEDLDTQVHSSEWAIERYGDSAIGAAREHRKMAELIETRENWVAKIEDCQAWLTRARVAL